MNINYFISFKRNLKINKKNNKLLYNNKIYLFNDISKKVNNSCNKNNNIDKVLIDLFNTFTQEVDKDVDFLKNNGNNTNNTSKFNTETNINKINNFNEFDFNYFVNIKSNDYKFNNINPSSNAEDVFKYLKYKMNYKYNFSDDYPSNNLISEKMNNLNNLTQLIQYNNIYAYHEDNDTGKCFVIVKKNNNKLKYNLVIKIYYPNDYDYVRILSLEKSIKYNFEINIIKHGTYIASIENVDIVKINGYFENGKGEFMNINVCKDLNNNTLKQSKNKYLGPEISKVSDDINDNFINLVRELGGNNDFFLIATSLYYISLLNYYYFYRASISIKLKDFIVN